jgi:hypothetical protein
MSTKKKQLPMLLGIKFIERGYHRDSMDLGVDPGAWYSYDAQDKVLRGFWRVGISKPHTMHPLKRTAQ